METFTQDKTTYTTHKVMIKNTQYNVMVVEGEYNYINVNKITHIRGIGKQFESFDAAINNYKNHQLKLEIFKIQMGLS
ncbi:MAG: hypothetical protein P8I94_04385 [Emcibacteraceae bacterium]|nr:hypothetical protein [Emcibacteraceae bacterium]